MGIAASQARLLTITARLTSNEYESQQLSNAKMRLSTKSEDASREYINALNQRQLMYSTYDAQGDPVTTPLTASCIYQYSDMKNQYSLVNNSGQILVSSEDAKNYEKATNLDKFLALNGVNKIYKTQSMQANAEELNNDTYQAYYNNWISAVNKAKTEPADTGYPAAEQFAMDRDAAYQGYMFAKENYEKAIVKMGSGIEIDMEPYLEALNQAKDVYSVCTSFDTWAQHKAMVENPSAYEGAVEYYRVLGELLSEAEHLGCTTYEDMYTYDNQEKAQWYTNLWYRMNGESSEKSAQGANKTNYAILDANLANSESWIQNAITQGVITLEVAANSQETHTLKTDDSSAEIPGISPLTLKLDLKGITWTSTTYSSCIDFTEQDNDKAIARAEAEYERKNKEISAKDQTYTNKIKALDTEHTALQTEYESVKSAMDKNISRSYKTFNS